MSETISFGGLVVPGTYVRVQSEGLIGAAAVSTGNIGIVGRAPTIDGDTHLFGDFATAKAKFLSADPTVPGPQGLLRSLELAYRNGARSVYAHGLSATATQTQFDAFDELIKEDVNILIAPELPTAVAQEVLASVLETAENAGKDIIAVIGSDTDVPADIVAQVPEDDRIVFTAPGVMGFDPASGGSVALSGTFSAAAVAGLLSTLAPHQSPTNKQLPGVVRLARRFSYAETIQLLDNRVAVLEQRGGVRVVRGLTTDPGAFKQITTRRITDFAKAGMRKAANPFIGKLNNVRVRKALQGAIDGFLTTMLQDEQLTGYQLDVTATREDEKAGRALVNAVIVPTFSIDFVAVTMVLE
jgi:hypothetical protein